MDSTGISGERKSTGFETVGGGGQIYVGKGSQQREMYKNVHIHIKRNR